MGLRGSSDFNLLRATKNMRGIGQTNWGSDLSLVLWQWRRGCGGSFGAELGRSIFMVVRGVWVCSSNPGRVNGFLGFLKSRSDESEEFLRKLERLNGAKEKSQWLGYS